MAFLNISNQLIQIDTGKVSTYLYNPLNSPIAVYAGIGESQVIGQRYVGIANTSNVEPQGSEAIYKLVQYLPTSAITTGNLAAVAAPVYWANDVNPATGITTGTCTFSTVTGTPSEGLGIAFPAGYMMVNTASVSGLTAAALTGPAGPPKQGTYLLIQVAGFLSVGVGSDAAFAVGDTVIGAAGNFVNARVAAGTASTYPRNFGTVVTAYSSGNIGILLNCDTI